MEDSHGSHVARRLLVEYRFTSTRTSVTYGSSRADIRPPSATELLFEKITSLEGDNHDRVYSAPCVDRGIGYDDRARWRSPYGLGTKPDLYQRHCPLLPRQHRLVGFV